MTVFLTIYAAVAIAYWLFMAYGAIRLNGLPRLSRIASTRPDRWPKVSVVVPGCNEADKVEEAARTLLAEEYPDLEIILVDDRSTDGTGAVMDRVAAGDPRARVIHITKLPDGWLGKVHALDTGLKASWGEYVLFTDADVHFTPGTIRLAMAHVLEKGVDHLSALPNLYPTNVLLDAALSATIRQLMVFMRVWKVADPESRAHAGVGAFNLVRRSAFNRTPGFEWLRLETADDVGLGLMMKRFGNSSRIVTAFDLLALHWYRSFREAARGAEKGWASALHFSLARAFFAAVAAIALELAPILLPVLPFLQAEPSVFLEDVAGWATVIVLMLCLVAVASVWRWVGSRPWPHLLSSLAVPVLVALLVRAAWLGWRRGGVLWRGTLYPTEILREGRRVDFP